MCYHVAMSVRSWTDEQLIEAVRQSESMAQVAFALGLKCTAAGNRSTIKKYIKQLELDTSHWTGQAWVGTREQHPVRQSLAEYMIEGSTYSTYWLGKRLLNEGLKEHRCVRCGRTTWEGEPIPLELDHINGVSNDHRFENLRMLCNNCHALTPTWRGRNKRHASVTQLD